jgi:hypothetical protein
MFLSPEVAIVQHSTGVMQVTWDYFENGITYFTNLIYTSIRFATGSGETAPFVGHNAFLRWKGMFHSLQSIIGHLLTSGSNSVCLHGRREWLYCILVRVPCL